MRDILASPGTSSDTPAGVGPPLQRLRAALRMGGGLAVAGLLLAAAIHLSKVYGKGVLAWQAALVERNRAVGTFSCIALFVPWIAFGLLSSPLELFTGFLFGAVWGALINSVGKLLGCTLSFYIGQHCLKSRVDRVAASNWRVQRVKGLLQGEPWRVAFLLRLAMIPIAIKNYGSSAADLHFRIFLVTCATVDSSSGAVLASIGANFEDLASALAGGGGEGSAGGESDRTTVLAQQILILLSLGAVLVLLFGFGWWAKNHLLEEPPPELQTPSATQGEGATDEGQPESLQLSSVTIVASRPTMVIDPRSPSSRTPLPSAARGGSQVMEA
jgi:uncharacterized membrane protein YdjX (TVP38/TMEM64 family)